MIKPLLLAATALTMLFGAAGVTAAAAQKSQPGDPLYGLKAWSEETLSHLQVQTRQQIQLRENDGTSEPEPVIGVQERQQEQLREQLHLQEQTHEQLNRQEQLRKQLHQQEAQSSGPGNPDAGNPWTTDTPVPLSGYGPGPGTCDTCVPQPHHGAGNGRP